MTRPIRSALATMLLATALTSAEAAAPLPSAAPAAEGFAPDRLQRLHTYLDGVTQRGDYLGAVALVARHGRIVDWQAYGWRDLAHTQKMPKDAIFRIYSMTKTVTAVAVLTLMEEGKLTIDDPVEKYLPEFAHMGVWTGGTAAQPQTRPAESAITIRQLLSHTAGFATYFKSDAEITRLFDSAQLGQSPDLKEYAARVARLPLGHDPGAQFHYDGVPVQVASRIVEVVSGMPYDRYLQTHVFGPLNMQDTGFEVPESKRARIADMTTTDADGKLTAPAAGVVPAPGQRMNPYFSGAGGLYSTAADYARFAQMLLNGGSLDGATVLGRKSVELMMLNHLSHLNPPVHEFTPSEGFGLGGSVLLDVARKGRLGSVGAFGWSGAGGTYYTIDPREQLVAILMTQHLPQGLPHDPPKLPNKFYNLVYQGLTK
ncbi:class A beta-lactamase-related serine hydrolase [Massilia arenosa]|uniref:Class A beta-lactamase-related serine hydrolase n=1 Tax=Zemynaea arenosa TaxID=2561931 RepID=A0A4Y9S5F1_9BURK|nr:serine hydrolase domain-containing protein [Massilia arenosa]TFW16570.1 class A beta-lactamase-related serine hydrolase [Massilia arenosa]